MEDLYSHGLWTIVDFHQDAFTERYCGEGVPDWLLQHLEPIDRRCEGWLPEAKGKGVLFEWSAGGEGLRGVQVL